MPLIVTSPEGKKYKITPPEGATQEDIDAQIRLITGATPTTPYRTASGAEIAPPSPALTKGEKIDRALTGIPTAVAMAATLPVSVPSAATAGLGALIRAATIRAGVAALGGGTGSVIQSSLQEGLETPGAPKDTAEVINRALKEGVMQGATQGIGEFPGIVLGPVPAVALQKFRTTLPKTHGGLQYLRGKWDEIKAASDARRITAAETASETVDAFRAAYQPHQIGESAQDAATLFRQKFLQKEAEGYSKMEQALQGTRIDYRDVADRLIKLEERRPKAKGGLSAATEPEADWAALVESMKAGQKPRTVPVDKGEEEVRGTLGELMRAGRPGKLKIQPAANAEEDAAAVLRARSTISQRLWELKSGRTKLGEGHTKEYVKGLEDLLSSIDQKLIGAANSIDPLLGEGYRELLKFSGSQREIMKSAIFKMAEDNKGDLAKALLSSRNPDNVNLFMEIAKGGALKPDDVTAVQRAAIESMLLRTKGVEQVVDLESFATRLAQTGDAGKRLFADKKSAAVVERLQALSKEVRALPKRPGDIGMDVIESNEAKLMEIVAASAGFRLTSLVFLPREGYRILTKQLMKIADNPKDFEKLHSLWKAYQKGAMTGPAAANAALNAFRSYRVAESVEPLLAPAHEQRR